MSFVVALLKNLAGLLGLIAIKNADEVIRDGLQECRKAVRQINKSLKKAKTVAEKQHLLSALISVKSYRVQFKAKLKKGAGLNHPKETAKHRVMWEDVHSAFQSRVRTGVIINQKHSDVKPFLIDAAMLFKRRIQNALKKDGALKVNGVLCGEFQVTKADEIMSENKYLNTKNAVIDRYTDLDEWFLSNIHNPILKDLDEFQENHSGFALAKVINLTISINKYNPLHAGDYIKLPTPIKRKKACINVQNMDDMCFAWAVVSALFPVQAAIAPRTSSYPNPKDVLNLRGIQFPMTLRQVPRFEKQNSLSIHVYRLDIHLTKKIRVIPAYLTKNKKERHINLLMIQDNYYEDNADSYSTVKYHYVWIKSLSRLISSQLNKFHCKKHICDRCLHYFLSEEKLCTHLKNCIQLNNGPVPRVPTEDKKWLEFKDYRHKEKVPFIVYADTECLLIPVEDDPKKTTQKYQKHVPFSVGYYVKCSYDDSLSFYKSYTGSNCMQWFVKELEEFAEHVETVFLCDLPMNPLSFQENIAFYSSTSCHICEKPFQSGDKRVRDHCHSTGGYRGPAHESCNLNLQDSHTVPVVFHNMSSYDGHMTVMALAEVDGKIDILPLNKERYISFTKHIPGNLVNFRFIDSMRFMNSSLDSLASYLTEYPILKSEFKDLSEEQFSLLARKGIFPYDYMNGWDKLNDEKLPSQPHFYNKLNDAYISKKEYRHAQTIWKHFGCKTMKDYSELYMKVDILLLADVFEQFRNTSHQTYGLDPAHSYTLPGFAWQCMFYKTSQKLELLTDLEMVLFIEKGIRGGLSQCSKRYAEANNKYMPSYDPSKEESYLMYFDINNQYGWAMIQYLPYGCFKWLSRVEINQLDVNDVADNADTGYIFEVDLEIPAELHDTFSDLPPCPEHRVPEGSRNKKLLATLYNKTEYVIHYRNLKQALALGVQLTKIHRVISFKQSAWLKPYIDLNTRLRQAAKNEFEKNLFKLMNNAVFGKTMENIRKHSSIKLVTKWDGRYGAEALISRPEFKSCTIISENLVILELAKSEVFFNKPIYVGMSILDLAKTTIYDFHYNYMASQFPNCSVIYTDTDSLIYEIKHIDVYDMIRRDCYKYFDTSDYDENNIYNIPKVNKKVLGLMKDENGGRIMTHFIGLRSKMYATRSLYTPEELEKERLKLEAKDIERAELAMILSNLNTTKKIKGIKKCVISNKITFEDYIECLKSFTEKYVCQNLIQSRSHELHTITQTKIGLSPHDDKRRISKTSMETLPWGHCSVMIED